MSTWESGATNKRAPNDENTSWNQKLWAGEMDQNCLGKDARCQGWKSGFSP